MSNYPANSMSNDGFLQNDLITGGGSVRARSVVPCAVGLVARWAHHWRTGLALALMLLIAGCHTAGKHGKDACDDGCCIDGETCDDCGQVVGSAGPPISRRVYISDRSVGVGSEHHAFALELVSALNTMPHCQASLLPADAPIETVSGSPPGGTQTALELAGGPTGTLAVEEILLVYVTDVQPYRPMRISAVLERRSTVDGSLISRQERTWNAPPDDEPLYPSPFNRKILRRPPPLEVVQDHELKQVSPRAFLRTVATQVAQEYMTSPL